MDFSHHLLAAIEIFGVATGMIGNYLVVKKRRVGFWVWLLGNIGNIGFFVWFAHYGYALLYAYFSAMCILGLMEWKKEPVS